MRIDLLVKRVSDRQTYTVTCDLRERAVFGRTIASPAHLEGSEISREHFALSERQGAIYVEDLSANGTLVNGKPVPHSKPKKLGEGDVIEVPDYEIYLAKGVPRAEPVAIPAVANVKGLEWATSFTVWEILVILAALASFVLLVYYFVS